MAKMMNGRAAAGMFNNDIIAGSYSSIGMGNAGVWKSW
jgi:hypothetical protein